MTGIILRDINFTFHLSSYELLCLLFLRYDISSALRISYLRVTGGSDVELMRINFGAIIKPAALTNWIGDIWFPQALIEADAATILTGARPVRAVKIPETGAVQIRWEDLQPDLSVKAAGGLEIRVIQGEAPAITVVRLSGGSLPGEMQLIDRLVEGVNKNVYKRQICSPVEDISKK